MSNEIEKDENLDLVEQETNSNALKTEAEQGGFDFTTPSPNEGMASGPVENFLDNQSSRLGNWIDDTFQGDQTTQEELLDERQRQKVAGIANEQDRQDALNESTDLLDVIPREVIRAPLGAIEDAANSVALTVDKTGDEFKKQINQALGRPVNPDQDPSSDEYESWFDGSNKIIAENQTAVGKFARGIGEFWVLTRWSGKALGPAKGKASTMLGNTQLVRAANPMIQSNRYSRWASEVGKRIWQVGSDGVIADFVMSSSEGKNLANLAEEHAPWLLPDLTAALSADPEDTWYVERFKGALVGTSFNYVGHIVGGIVKGAWKSGRWMLAQKKAGKSLTEEILNEGDKIFNNTINEELSKGVVNDQSVADRLSEVRYEYGKGINPNNSKDEYILKHLLLEDQAEYARLIDGKEPSEWFINNLKKRGKADFTEIEVTDEDAFWREAFNNLSDEDFLDTKGILNMPERPSLRELAINDYFELAQKIGGRKGDPWLPIQNMSLVQSAENAMREFDPVVNADGSADFQRATYDGSVVKYDKVKGDYQVSMEDLEKMWKELQWNFREEGSLDTAYRTIDEPYISKAAAGNKQLYDIYKEVADDMDRISMGMKESDYRMTIEADIELARPFMEPIAKFIDGKDVDISKEYKRILKALRAKGGTDSIRYDFIRDTSDVTKSGRVRTKRVTVPGVSQMRANLFVLHSLGKITAKLAKNTLDINNDLPLTRNWEMFTDLMKVMFIENKLWGFHWGKQGQASQAGIAEVLAMWKKPPKAKYAELQQEADKIFTELENLYKAGDKEAVQDLLQMALMTNGQVTAIAQIPEYLGRKLLNRPGAKGMETFTGQLKQVPARTIDEAYQTVIQSWLGHPKTAVNALFMTNALNMSRTLEGWVGVNLPWRKYTFKESELVGTIYEGMDFSQFKKAKLQLLGIQWSSLQRAQLEAWEMFKRNWEINQKPKVFDEDGGVIFRKPDYGSKFDDNTDNAQWENLGHFYEKYGTAMQKKGYGLVNSLYKINKVPLMRSNRSAMNAGDAYTRTIIGRQQMAVSAAEQAIKDGLDLDDLPEFIKKNDEIFREKIFRKNKDDMWVVKDPRATAIGDEVTLMKQIPEQFKGFQVLERNPWTNRFFAFMRPSFNNAGNVFDRTPLKVFTEQYRDIVEIGSAESAQRWNLSLDELPRARDEMVGRMALGTTLAGIVWGLALNGHIIGDYPADEADRKLWKLNKIQPNSVAIPKPYNPLTQEKGANGWIYVSFGRSDIAGTLFSMVANGAYYADVMGEDYFTQWENKMAWYFGMAVADVGVIQSASDLSSLFDAGTGNMPNPERSFAKLFRPQLGVGGQSRFLADLFDNTQKESNTFLEYVRQQDIIFKSNVPNDYDILGKNRGRGNAQPLRNGPHNPLLKLFNSLSPFTITSTEGDNVKKTLLDIRYNLGAEVSTLKGVPLNSQEKSDLKLVLAEDKEFRTELEQMISSDLWQRNMNKYIELNKKNVDGWKAQEAWFYSQIGSIFERAKNRATETLKDSERFPEYNNNSADSLFNRITVRGYQKDAASTSDPVYSESLYNQIEKIRKYGTTGVAPQ